MVQKHKEILRFLATFVPTIVLMLGIIWGIVKPKAEEFIKDTVRNEKFASQQSLDVIDSRTRSLETTIDSVQKKIDVQTTSQIRMESDINNMVKSMEQQRQDIRQLMFGIRQLQRDSSN